MYRSHMVLPDAYRKQHCHIGAHVLCTKKLSIECTVDSNALVTPERPEHKYNIMYMQALATSGRPSTIMMCDTHSSADAAHP